MTRWQTRPRLRAATERTLSTAAAHRAGGGAAGAGQWASVLFEECALGGCQLPVYGFSLVAVSASWFTRPCAYGDSESYRVIAEWQGSWQALGEGLVSCTRGMVGMGLTK